MDPIKKTTLRAAVLIHEQLAGDKRQDVPICLPEYSWNKTQQLRHQIDLASRRGWHGAAARLTEDLAGAMDGCRRELENSSSPCLIAAERPIPRLGWHSLVIANLH